MRPGVDTAIKIYQTINRLLSFFPAEEQMAVRARLAEQVKAIVSLRLLVNKKEDGRVPAVEVMRSTRSIQECIRDPQKTQELVEYIAERGTFTIGAACCPKVHPEPPDAETDLINLKRKVDAGADFGNQLQVVNVILADPAVARSKINEAAGSRVLGATMQGEA